LISKIEPLLKAHGLQNEEIIIRNELVVPTVVRVLIGGDGFVGTALGKYNFHIGGDRQGLRLNKIYKESWMKLPFSLSWIGYLQL